MLDTGYLLEGSGNPDLSGILDSGYVETRNWNLDTGYWIED
jgi:hypothetical protein